MSVFNPTNQSGYYPFFISFPYLYHFTNPQLIITATTIPIPRSHPFQNFGFKLLPPTPSISFLPQLWIFGTINMKDCPPPHSSPLRYMCLKFHRSRMYRLCSAKLKYNNIIKNDKNRFPKVWNVIHYIQLRSSHKYRMTERCRDHNAIH